MPLFTFRCTDCGAQSEQLIKAEQTDKVVCPECGGNHMEKSLPAFACGSGQQDGASSCSTGCCPFS